MTERKELDELLDAVSRGAEVDWGSSRSAAESAEAARQIRNLHVIAEVGRCAREGTPPRDGPGEQDPAPEGPALERWGPLTPLEPLGEGTFATVYRAWDAQLRRHVALKLLHGGDGAIETAALAEARLLARVDHPNVVTVHGVAQHDGRAGIWMSLVEGVDLKRIVAERGPLPPAEVVAIGTSIASALAAIHTAGVVHGDIKPQNVVRDEQGHVTITDFGVGAIRASSSAWRTLRGTPLYLAPELLDGREASPVSDVYALGVLLYLLATGAHPVDGGTLTEVMDALRAGRRRGVRERAPGLPEPLAHVIETATSLDPATRYQSAGDVVTALEACGGDQAPKVRGASRRGLPRARLAALVAALIAGTILVTRLAPWGGGPQPDVQMQAVQSGQTRALVTGDAVSPVDLLQLDVHLRAERHVYVLNLDASGNAVVMFPIDGWPVTNPLPSGHARLPGERDGEPLGWTLSADSGVESFYVVIAEHPLTDFEDALERVPVVTAAGGLSVRPADDTLLATLTRGVTGMSSTALPDGDARARLAELVGSLSDPDTDERAVVHEIRLLNRGRP